MSQTKRPVVLCVACYFKGKDFLSAAKASGSRVLLLTTKNLEDKDWPRESIDEFYFLPDQTDDWDSDRMIKGLAYAMRSEKIDIIVALDDYDVERAALLREHFRLPGMGQTRSRYFRDKLAMRMKAQESGLSVPGFSPLFNDAEVNEFADNFAGPWMVKPRSQASATGIKKVRTKEELWAVIHKLGDERDDFLVEQFKPGDVYHVDALISGGKVLFARSHKYMNTPLEVAHEGGIFRTHTEKHGSADDKALLKANREVMKAFGMVQSASHTEFIKCHEDGKFYFLETAARVGGAHIAELTEASSGINLWAEWAKMECLAAGETYKLPKTEKKYAGLIISLSRRQNPDTSSFDEPEIWWRMDMDHHIGLIVSTNTHERAVALLEDYGQRIREDFHASAPIRDKPSH